MIKRSRALAELRGLLARHPVVAILGARQVGKTTLARRYVEEKGGAVHTFDLEDTRDLARLHDLMLALDRLRGLVVLDEVQRRPEIFPALRVLADRRPLRARFRGLGSASPELLQQSSETLAGRIAYQELHGFSLEEVGEDALDRLWLRGGLPRSFLTRSESQSGEWRREFVRTFLERHLPQLGLRIPAGTMRRFWSMLAHYHGQVWNASEFGRSFGVADTTVRRYLDVLEATFLARVLPPWVENLKKRQVKSPKVYLSDPGLVHTLLDVGTRTDLEGHPKVGASWEGFLLEQVVARIGARREECFFWAAHSGAELDLLVKRGRRRVGFEFKRTSSPQVTRSMRTALADLGLSKLHVVHAGKESFPLAKGIRAVAARDLMTEVTPWRRV